MTNGPIKRRFGFWLFIHHQSLWFLIHYPISFIIDSAKEFLFYEWREWVRHPLRTYGHWKICRSLSDCRYYNWRPATRLHPPIEFEKETAEYHKRKRDAMISAMRPTK